MNLFIYAIRNENMLKNKLKKTLTFREKKTVEEKNNFKLWEEQIGLIYKVHLVSVELFT